jgi:hypothetical protein
MPAERDTTRSMRASKDDDDDEDDEEEDAVVGFAVSPSPPLPMIMSPSIVLTASSSSSIKVSKCIICISLQQVRATAFDSSTDRAYEYTMTLEGSFKSCIEGIVAR